MSQIEMAVVPDDDYKIVSVASIARKLIRDGYHVVDIKPKRNFERETVFVFKNENGFMTKYSEYLQERKAHRGKKPE